ncbi:MAG: hypothetical protein FD174_2560 [Geobacteraceae bacterium]|nr:MAG: hypothetical protein FD174_2560 [Geobacteraceae bacterium]
MRSMSAKSSPSRGIRLKSSDPGRRFAVAFDVGTTTIAASLVDTGRGARVAMAGGLNPQREFGPDVLSRLEAACRSAENLQRMMRLVNGELQRLTGELLSTAGIRMEAVEKIAIAGNPAMEHFLLGLPVTSLAFPPYRPLFTSGRAINASTLGWDANVNAFVFPLPGGFVGGDLVAFLYGQGHGSWVMGHGISHPSPLTPHPSRLFLDLGTNGELALMAGGKIYATSAAAGPAFEGGNLSCGMAALPGAISGVEFTGDRVTVTVIGGESPIGVCGSGVITAVAGLLRSGILDCTGRLLRPTEISSNLANQVNEIDGETAFVLYRDAQRAVYLTQEDIRQVQLAKAAVRSGMEVLFERAGVPRDSLQEVILTGSFGSILPLESLKNVGIFSEKMVKIACFVREGALSGVENALCDSHGFEAVDRLATSIRVIPLSGNPAFEKHFLEQMNFPDS